MSCKNKNKKREICKKNIKHSFTGKRLTLYSGISPIHRHLHKKVKLFRKLTKFFPDVLGNAGQYSDVQLLTLMI